MPMPKALPSGRLVHFPSDRYPILSFLYGVYAGDENDMNCFETNDYMSAYLASPATKDVGSLFKSWLVPRHSETPLPQPTSAQWDQLLQLLKEELQRPSPPVPMR
jgi:hypothetical protein